MMNDEFLEGRFHLIFVGKFIDKAKGRSLDILKIQLRKSATLFHLNIEMLVFNRKVAKNTKKFPDKKGRASLKILPKVKYEKLLNNSSSSF